jgi:AcrR family transcriptional regulator
MEEILDVAAALFAERGFAGADIQQLADQLGIGKGTIYRYFPSKQDLFLAAVDRVMSRLTAQIDDAAAVEREPLRRVAAAIEAYLAFFEQHPQFVELLIQERAEFRDRELPTYFRYRDANIGRWREIFRGLIAEGRVRDMPVERITEVLSDLLYGTMFTNYFAGRRRSYRLQAGDILDVVFCGVLAGGGREGT